LANWFELDQPLRLLSTPRTPVVKKKTDERGKGCTQKENSGEILKDSSDIVFERGAYFS